MIEITFDDDGTVRVHHRVNAPGKEPRRISVTSPIDDLFDMLPKDTINTLTDELQRLQDSLDYYRSSMAKERDSLDHPGDWDE